MLQFLLNMENTPIRIDQPSRDSRIVDLIFRAQKSCGIYLLITAVLFHDPIGIPL